MTPRGHPSPESRLIFGIKKCRQGWKCGPLWSGQPTWGEWLTCHEDHILGGFLENYKKLERISLRLSKTVLVYLSSVTRIMWILLSLRMSWSVRSLGFCLLDTIITFKYLESKWVRRCWENSKSASSCRDPPSLWFAGGKPMKVLGKCLNGRKGAHFKALAQSKDKLMHSLFPPPPSLTAHVLKANFVSSTMLWAF